ncbi:MAG TPA: SDR family oxidoreductase [Vicinamibacterales bacterium]|nr:SDR family oxidoreductase [Vicinamibacterales bacterium]
MFRLDGRTALITGGTRGIGAAIADLFAEAGANVVVAGRRPDDGRHRSVAFDVADDDAVAAGVAEAREQLGGRIDILVNSAGMLLASDPGGNIFVGQTLGPNCGDVMP